MDENEAAQDVERIVTGDADALQRLILRSHGPLRGVVAAHVDAGLRHRIDPDDVLQQAYVSAFEALCRSPADADGAAVRFENPGHFYKWLEQIALNALRDMQRALRRQKRDAARELAPPAAATDSYPDLIRQLAGADPTPSRAVAGAEAVAAVMSCLARLPAEQRTVLRLRFIENVPFEEIAERVGKSREAVYMICHRGLTSLRGLLVSITRYLTRR